MFGFIGIMLLNNERLGLIFHLAAFECFYFLFLLLSQNTSTKINLRKQRIISALSQRSNPTWQEVKAAATSQGIPNQETEADEYSLALPIHYLYFREPRIPTQRMITPTVAVNAPIFVNQDNSQQVSRRI